jgi:hypothetical protein
MPEAPLPLCSRKHGDITMSLRPRSRALRSTLCNRNRTLQELLMQLVHLVRGSVLVLVLVLVLAVRRL